MPGAEDPGFFAGIREALGTPKQQQAAAYTPAATFAGEIPPYAAAALTAEIMNVAAAPAGTRNDTLNIAAVKLGSLVAGGHLPPGLVLQELTNAATAAGLEAAEIRATLNSGLRKGEQQPRNIPDTDKETERWLNTLGTGPAPLPESANGSTPAPSPHPGAPGPQNGTQDSATAAPGTAGRTAAPAANATAPGNSPTPSQLTESLEQNSPSMTQSPWETTTPAEPQPGTPSSSTVLPWEKTPAPAPHASTAANGHPPTTPTAANGTTNTGPASVGPTPTADPLAAPPALLMRETAMELLRLQSRAAAQRMFNQSNVSTAVPAVRSLTSMLAEPDQPVEYRIHGLLPVGGRIVLAAQYKAGKSTMVGNIVKALADQKPFLSRYRVEPSNRITVIDDELSLGQLRRWYREQEIVNTDAVHLVSLRGAMATFDILDPVVRQQWAQRLAGTEILILDCLRPVMDALGLSEDKDGGKFLVAFDALIAECGASEAIVVHHMGHGGARSRGDSRILDWPDATWKLTREDAEDSKSPRYFSAHGRDVDEDEQLLQYSRDDARALWLAGGNRLQVRQEEAMDAVVAYVKQNPGVSSRGLQTGLGGNAGKNRTALKKAVAEGILRQSPGVNGGSSYWPAFQHFDEPQPPQPDRDRDRLI